MSVTAFVRTNVMDSRFLPHVLDPIMDLFDEVLIIHNESPPWFEEQLQQYTGYSHVRLFRYPHRVLKCGSSDYANGNYDYDLSLAGYYQFGLEKINTEWFVKIDTDQIYIKDNLRMLLEAKESGRAYKLAGFNIFLDRNVNDVLFWRPRQRTTVCPLPLNGFAGDTLLIEKSMVRRYRMDDGKGFERLEHNHDWSGIYLNNIYWYNMMLLRDMNRVDRDRLDVFRYDEAFYRGCVTSELAERLRLTNRFEDNLLNTPILNYAEYIFLVS